MKAPFKDPEFARQAALKSAAARRQQAEARRLPTVREMFGDHVEEVAAQLITLALSGDRQACEFILTMTHGKPKQSVEVAEPPALDWQKILREAKKLADELDSSLLVKDGSNGVADDGSNGVNGSA